MGSDGTPGFLWRGRLGPSLLLLGLTLLFLSPLLGAGFLRYDDPVYVTENLRVQAGLSLENLRWAFTTTYFGFYYPLTWLSHMADVSLFGLDPRGHHLVSLLLNALSAVLLFRFLDEATRDRPRSFLAAALFALHPLHVESAAWISERKDLLSIFFLFWALLAYLRYPRRPGAGRYLPVFLLLLASICAKPTAVTAPFLLLLLDLWPLGQLGTVGDEAPSPFPAVPWRRAILEKVPLLALSLLFGIVTLTAQKDLGAVTGLAVLPLSLRLSNAVVSAASYLAKAVVPSGLTVFYPFPLEGHPPGKVVPAAVLLVLITALSLREARRRPSVFTGWFWYLAALGPMLGIVQAGRQAMADRYTYLPLIGVTAALLWAFPALQGAGARRALTAAAAHDPESADALRRLGAILLDPGRKGGPRPQEAVAFLERAARISGRREPRILVQLAEAQRAAGKRDEARRTAEEAMEAARRRGDREAAGRASRLLGERP